ncbi:MAG: hypothetical protein AB1756_08915 [Acidobacteriota bacterium]
MVGKASLLLRQIEQCKDEYSHDAASRKLDLLQGLERKQLSRAREVYRLHEVLCFLRAYPDNEEILTSVERMLRGFAHRRDLHIHCKELTNSGISGTEIKFRFYFFTSCWLARRWPDKISIDWGAFRKKGKLEDFLHLLLPYSETPAIDELSMSPREWISELKGPAETDASFIIKRFEAAAASSFERETLYESFDIPIKIYPGAGTPSRTLARHPASPVVFQTRPFQIKRPSLLREVRRNPVSVRPLPPRDGCKLIDLAREAMVTRSRDLDVFEHASDEDVRLVDFGQGLQFACIGVIPERRLMLEAVYGFLTLKNGIPIGYVLSSALFRSAEVAFNMFETYRAAESAFIYSRVLAMVRHLFGCETFTIPPIQLGYENPEGLKSGAWWFYYKLGFRPHDRGVRSIVRAELEQMKMNPHHRSTIPTLEKLASENLFMYLDRPREDVLGKISLGDIGLEISHTLSSRFGANREEGIKVCSDEAARLLGLRSFRGFSAGKRLTWERWSPLIVSLDGVQGWSPAEKRALVQVVRAKGGQRESRFVTLFDRHHRLRQAILKLSKKQQPC